MGLQHILVILLAMDWLISSIKDGYIWYGQILGEQFRPISIILDFCLWSHLNIIIYATDFNNAETSHERVNLIHFLKKCLFYGKICGQKVYLGFVCRMSCVIVTSMSRQI